MKEMMMKVAFRKTNAPGLLPGIFNEYTKWSLKTAYPHGGVIIGDEIWHTTKRGFDRELFTHSENWDVFDTDVSDTLAIQRLTPLLGMRYDLISLLGFKIPINFSDSNALYCYEVLWVGLKGTHPKTLTTPEKIMAEILRRANAQAPTARVLIDSSVEHDWGLLNPYSATSSSMAAKHDLSCFSFTGFSFRNNMHLGA